MNIRASLFAISALVVLASSAQAVSLQNDTFDTGYTVGDLDLQNGYDAFNYTLIPFNVDDTAGVGGSYGVTANTNDDPFGFLNLASRPLNYAPTAANPILNASVDVASRGFVTGAFGTVSSAYGIGIYNTAKVALAEMYFQFAVGSTTEATVYYAGGDDGEYKLFTTTGGLNTFKNLAISLNTTTNVATFLLNGTSLGTSTYSASDAVIGDVDLSAAAIGFDMGAFDNLKVDAVAAVPEPSALAALGLGALALLRRRKRA